MDSSETETGVSSPAEEDRFDEVVDLDDSPGPQAERLAEAADQAWNYGMSFLRTE